MWGPWAIGMAGSNVVLAARFARAGLSSIKPTHGLRMLSTILQTSLAQLQSELVMAPIAWGKMLSTTSATPSIFETLQHERKRSNAVHTARVSTRTHPTAQVRHFTFMLYKAPQ